MDQPRRSNGRVQLEATDYALEFLREERDAPFLLVVGFKSAHTPYQPAERLLGLYEGATPAPPRNVAAIPPYPRLGELNS